MKRIQRYPSLLRKAFVAAAKRWGTHSAKRRFWDEEYRAGHWPSCGRGTDNDSPDPIYGFLERYSSGGAVLDLGCGSGITAMEMTPNFRSYLGVDISTDAVDKARAALNEKGRTSEHIEFVAADIYSFTPHAAFSVILFRECMYYIPFRKIKSLLLRYSGHLAPGGVFIVRLCDRHRYRNIVKLLESNFAIAKLYEPEDSTLAIIVFRLFVSSKD